MHAVVTPCYKKPANNNMLEKQLNWTLFLNDLLHDYITNVQ